MVQMVEDAYQAALAFGDSLLLLDRYFLTVPALEKLKSLNSSGDVHMGIVTKAQKSCTAFRFSGFLVVQTFNCQGIALCRRKCIPCVCPYGQTAGVFLIWYL